MLYSDPKHWFTGGLSHVLLCKQHIKSTVAIWEAHSGLYFEPIAASHWLKLSFYKFLLNLNTTYSITRLHMTIESKNFRVSIAFNKKNKKNFQVSLVIL